MVRIGHKLLAIGETVEATVGGYIMSFASRVSSITKQHMSNLKEAYNDRVARAESKARRHLADTRSKTERGKIKLQLEVDRMSARKELYEAQTAACKAKIALEKARKEAGDLTVSERFSRVGSSLGRSTIATYKALSKKPKRKRVSRAGTKVRKS